MAASICDCGRTIEQPKTGRRRTRCKVCSPPDVRPASRKAKQPAGAVVRLASAAPEGGQEAPGRPGLLTSTTRAQLEAHGREGTPDGVLALSLADSIDRGQHTGSSLAALAREFRTVLAAAMEGTAPVADVIDGIFGSRTG